MKRENMPVLVLGAAIVLGALIWTGVPVSSLLVPLVLLACPLMMIFMMRGMDHGGQGGGQDGHAGGCHDGHDGHDQRTDTLGHQHSAGSDSTGQGRRS